MTKKGKHHEKADGLFSTTFILTLNTSIADQTYQGSRFQEVWAQVTSDPYADLPQYKVTLSSFYDGMVNVLLNDSKRTIDDRSDLLPYFDKLLHPNGVCLKGRWKITEATNYSGYFSQGAEALIIARASSALTNTKRGTNRAFGLAGKLYPTTDEQHSDLLKTANFFTIEDLGGNFRDFFLDAKNTNDIIKVSPTLTLVLNSLIGAAAGSAFSEADESNVFRALIRQLYPIAELGLAPEQSARWPTWMRIVGNPMVPRVGADDFREELDVNNYPEGLIFDIEVADFGTRLGFKRWNKIGEIEFDESVVSSSCDHRLHFSHPKYREE